jgi:hypothetical protein
MKQKNVVADALSRLEIDSLKIQEEAEKSVNTSIRIRKKQNQLV